MILCIGNVPVIQLFWPNKSGEEAQHRREIMCNSQNHRKYVGTQEIGRNSKKTSHDFKKFKGIESLILIQGILLFF